MKRILNMLRGNRRSRQRPQDLGTPKFERLEPRLLLNAVPYMQDFSLGKPGGTDGWEYYSDNEGRIEVVNERLRMDDIVDNSTYSLNEAILHVDLTGKTGVTLTLDHWSLSDESTSLPSSFAARYKADGIALSVDGQHWVKVTDLNVNFTNKSFDLTSALQQAQSAAGGSSDLSNVRIKFQQYDNYSASTDGREFDNIRITLAEPEMEVLGNAQIIADGDITPSSNDYTDFGSVPQGNSVVRTFTIRNIGAVALNVTAVQWTGSTDFSVVKQPSPVVAANGGTTTFQIQFTPSGLGVQTATMMIANDDADENPYDFMIQGTGSSLVAQPVPYMQDFSLGKPGGTKGWEYYSDNEGRIEVVNGRLRMDDTTGNSTYSLNEAILHVNLTGKTGVTLTLDHWSLSDESSTLPLPPTIFVGHYNADGIALSVNGQHWVKVTDLNVNFTNKSFDLTSALLQAQAAAGGSSDLSNVRIKFQQYDNYSASSDGREFDNIRITLAEPEMEVLGNAQIIADGDITPISNDYTDFGSVPQGNSVVRTFTIRNIGAVALNVTAVQWTGSTDFTVIQQPSPVVAANGGTTTFQIQFTPTGPGLKTATMMIANDDADENPYDFMIQGTGLIAEPEMEVLGNAQIIADGDSTPSSNDYTDFGSVPQGGSVVRTFTIRNTGAVALNVTAVQWTGSTDFSVVQQPSPLVAPNGGTTTFQIQFTPSGTGLKTATLWISNNDSNENPYNFEIQGTGLIIEPEMEVLGNGQIIADGDIAPSSNDYTDFGSVPQGSSVVRTFTIRNTGADTLNVTAVQWTGSTDFSVVKQPIPVVAAYGGTTTFQIQFTPSGPGLQTATMMIANDDADENPYDFMIQGTGSSLVAQPVPYMQDFSLGKPGGTKGWEYYSDNEGRIEVVNGRLRMDDTTGNSTYSLNEAILHVNLTGKTGVTLTLDHWSLSDESSTLPLPPTIFVGHYNADGIALSVNGQHWVKVTDLNVNFTNKSFDLTSALQQAQAAAGSSDLSNVRIKFQQYDNYSAPSDGREFDNIRVQTTLAEPEMEVLGNGQIIADGDITPSSNDYTDFGSVPQGNSVVRTFTIRNIGAVALNVTAVQWTGSTDFAVIKQPSPVVAANGGTTTFQIQFTPSGPGVQTATLWIPNNDSNENPYNFVIQGTGLIIEPEIEVLGNGQIIADGDSTPSSNDYTDFGSVPQGSSVVRTFTIRNTGAGALNLTGVPNKVQWTGSTDFSVVQQPSPVVAANGGTTTFQIQFTPSGPGIQTATLWISNNDSNENPYNFEIQGTGLIAEPEMEVLGNGQIIADGDSTPSSNDYTDFGSVPQGSSVVRTFTIRNTGADTLNVKAVQWTGSTDFSVVQQPSPVVAAYGGTTTFQIQFTPSGPGVQTATMMIANDDADENPYDFMIQGTGSSLVAQPVPYMQDFSLGKPGGTKGWEYYSDNEGRIEVVNERLRMDDTTGNSTYSLNEAILHVNLTGKTGVTLTLDHWSLSDESSTLPLPPTIFVGHYNADGIALSVNGQHWVKVTDLNVNFTNKSFDLTSALLQAQAAAGSSDLSNVRIKFQQYDNYSAPSDGREFDNIRVQTTLAEPEMEVLGNGQIISDGDSTPSSNDYTDFGSVPQGSSVVRTFTIRNTGAVALNVTAVQWTGSTDFSVVQQPSPVVAANGGTTTFQIQFTPTGPGVQTATMMIANDDADENPYDFIIQGTGLIAEPEMEVLGNGQIIADGDSTPSSNDYTDFGSVPQGSSVVRTFTIRNTGADTLNVTAVQWTGSTDFSVVKQPIPVVAANGGTTTFQIQFTPSGPGLQTATMMIANDDADENPYDFMIQGTGSSLVAQPVPYMQDFSLGKPSGTKGWEYYSDNEGRIEVVNERLRMDDTTGNSTYSLNEAILHVNLTGKTGVTLTLDHWSLSDESSTLPLPPTIFVGHYNADGIALSVNGQHWVKVTDLNVNFTNKSFDLTSALLQAQAAAGGSSDLSNVRIKFQQYDNYSASSDGREFDNIRITLAEPEMEVLGNAQIIADGDITPSSNDYTDFGSVPQGNSVVRTFTIRNIGAVALNVTAVQWTGSTDFTVIQQPSPVVAANGGTTTFQIQFTPTGPGVQTATMMIANDDADENPYDFMIQGTGSSLVAQAVPYKQDFSLGKPDGTKGWEYYSDNEGRIEVVNERLRMDDIVDNSTYSLNEAILHVDLTGKTGVTLTLDHWSLSDESTSLPSSFVGRYKADGIALSVDGQHWVKVTDLSVNFTNRSFDLTSALLQAQAAAGGSSDLSNVRIKFQQYDNYSASTDGREFDNIKVS